MVVRALLPLLGALASAGLAATAARAAPARPRTAYRWVDPARVALAESGRASSNLLYLERCADGCTLSPGRDDARAATSSLLERTATIAPFEHGDQAWDEVVACVAELYAPFGVVVTDVDPGAAPHFEAIVAGTPADIGAGEVGGLAPFSCGVIDNAVTYSFANLYSTSRDICETVAQESAHAFGLEHEVLCADPMSYLTGCGAKAFRDLDAPCGELSARPCECGGETQNSVRALRAVFAPAPAPQSADPCLAGACGDDPAGCSAAGGRPATALWLVPALAFFLLRRRRN